MKKHIKKKAGFTLIEVVISITIIAILSVGVYDAYLVLIRQTRAGEVRQNISLEGKRISEEIKSTIENDKFTIVQGNPSSILRIGNRSFTDIGGVYTRFLDGNYLETDRSLAEFTETINLETTKTDQGGEVILDEDQTYDDTTNPLNINFRVFIGSEGSNGNTVYIRDEIQRENLEITSGKIILYAYFYQNPTVENEKTIKIKSDDGTELLSRTEAVKDINTSNINLCINFNEYNPKDRSPSIEVEINAYSEIDDIPNIYMEKDSNLNAEVNPCKGEINVYDNRAENAEEAEIGTLYDIEVLIRNRDGDIIFRGNSKQNIRWH